MKNFCIIQVKEKQVQNKSTLEKLFDVPDGRYLVELGKYNKRSTPQNRYYWGIVIPLLKESFKNLGHELTGEEVHEFLKAKFNHESIVNEDTGESVEVPLSTTRLTKEEFSNYVESIQRFAAEFLGVVIPDPETDLKLFQ